MSTPMALEDPAWAEKVLAVIEAYAAHGRRFTADDLHAVVGEPPHPNHWGAAFTAAKTRGLIVRDGYQTSRRPTRNHSVIAVWAPNPEHRKPR